MNIILAQVVPPLLLALIYWCIDKISIEYIGIEYHKAVSYTLFLILSLLVVFYIKPNQQILNTSKYLENFAYVVGEIITGIILYPVFDKILGRALK